MINVLDEIESFLRYHELSWKDVICLQIYKDNGYDKEDLIELELNYTSDDLERFLMEAKQKEYSEHIGFYQRLFGMIWLTENRWIERVVSIYDGSERWELKEVPRIPFR